MQVPSITAVGGPSLPPVSNFVQRLAAHLAQEFSGHVPAPARAPDAPLSLTPAMLRSALLEMGIAADAENLALADAFARLGLALTREALTEAHAALARAPGASPTAYALARAWSLPTTPAALRALAMVTETGPQASPQQALPPELMSWLSLAADTGMEAEALAAHLFVMAQGMGRSTENRVAAEAERLSHTLASVQDTRTTLLRLAQGSADKGIQRGADALASHIEGQQLINQTARRGQEGNTVPFYFAVPVQFGDEPALAEMRLWSWDEEEDTDDLPADSPYLRATVRLATARLGRVQAEIIGTLSGTLLCRLGAEKPVTVRLLTRHTATLAAALATLPGWRMTEVRCGMVTDWTPLWFGGDTLAAPRPCVDWRA